MAHRTPQKECYYIQQHSPDATSTSCEENEEGFEFDVQPKRKYFDTIQEKKQYIEEYTKKKKTELCKNFTLTGQCRYGKECSFAHGQSELQPKIHLHQKYKTKPCKRFFRHGYCPYGIRCQYIHGELKDINKPEFERYLSEVFKELSLPQPTPIKQLKKDERLLRNTKLEDGMHLNHLYLDNLDFQHFQTFLKIESQNQKKRIIALIIVEKYSDYLILFIMSGNAFITENFLPTLEVLDTNQARKLKELCKDMEHLMGNTNEKIQTILQTQQNKFFKAFKVVIETMFQEFQNLQKKFEEYIAYHENETEVVNAQNKLVFFRKECSLLNSICGDLKSENQKLKQMVADLKNDIYYHHMALVKQTTKKQDLQNKLVQIKNQQQIQNSIHKVIGHTQIKPILLKAKDNNFEQIYTTKSKGSRTLSTQLKYNSTKTPQQSLNKTFDDPLNKQEHFYSESYQKKGKTQECLDSTIKTNYEQVLSYTNEFIL